MSLTVMQKNSWTFEILRQSPKNAASRHHRKSNNVSIALADQSRSDMAANPPVAINKFFDKLKE